MIFKNKIIITLLIACSINLFGNSFDGNKNSRDKIVAENNLSKKTINSENVANNKKDLESNDSYIRQGVVKALNAYRDENYGGMVGMRKAVEECYSKIDKSSNINDIKRCFAMDLTSHYFDDSVCSYMHFPRNQYFLLQNVNIRLLASLKKLSIDIEKQKENIANWIKEIQKQYEIDSLKILQN